MCSLTLPVAFWDWICALFRVCTEGMPLSQGIRTLLNVIILIKLLKFTLSVISDS